MFVNRREELSRLRKLAASPGSGLAVVFGRRRVGKTRLLVEWVKAARGVYTVADQSSPEVQRAYLKESLGVRLPALAQQQFHDWRGLLAQLAREARLARWRGPIVFDEFPYLVAASPEVPSVFQQWLDHDAREARLVVAIAGSSQRMMQGLVLDRSAPLFGRASELLDVRPMAIAHLARYLGIASPALAVEAYAAWGGVPRYWELAAQSGDTTLDRIDRLVLDPLGALSREPDLLLLEETPSALEVRPVLDAIGAGAHRVSEIAGRIGRPATSLARPLSRLIEMGLVRREVPFGESERTSKQSLYRFTDPFFRLWFRMVAPHRALLTEAPPRARHELAKKSWPGLVATAWEESCRQYPVHAPPRSSVGRLGPWKPAGRWWSRSEPEWDVVSQSVDGDALLVGEAKWSFKAPGASELRRLGEELSRRPLPLPFRDRPPRVVIRVLFVPHGTTPIAGTVVVTAKDLLRVNSR